jgi:hypothetical protein
VIFIKVEVVSSCEIYQTLRQELFDHLGLFNCPLFAISILVYGILDAIKQIPQNMNTEYIAKVVCMVNFFLFSNKKQCAHCELL